MIAFYLLPYPVRGIRAPYLWVFYKWLSQLTERSLFIVGEDYLRSPECFINDGRWELSAETRHVYKYDIPTPNAFAKHDIRTLTNEIFAALLTDCHSNPLTLFRRLLTERIPVLEGAFEAALTAAEKEGTSLEAIVTWCNCPSLNAIAAKRRLRVVHLEVGPLRAPLYRPTAYFDFSGVNGNTEAERRYAKLPRTDRMMGADHLQEFFSLSKIPPRGMANFTGLALQVEDDSNLVAFGNDFDNQAATTYLRLMHGSEGPLTIRSHPGSLFKVSGDWFESDRSYDSLEFILRCHHIVTINSSIGLEALLLGTKITILGDSSFAFILSTDDKHERLSRLAFYLFAYLIPGEFQFDLRYLRFRLTDPDEASIVTRHLDAYLGSTTYDHKQRSVWDLICTVLEQRREV